MNDAEIRELKLQNQALSARNKQLSELLKVSRDRLQDLSAQVEALGEPASTLSLIHISEPTRLL